MGPSEKTFQQVRSILGKLDRNIDSLRAQRSGPATPPPAPQPAAQERQVPGSTAGAAKPVQRATSVYGRATPLQSPPAGN